MHSVKFLSALYIVDVLFVADTAIFIISYS